MSLVFYTDCRATNTFEYIEQITYSEPIIINGIAYGTKENPWLRWYTYNSNSNPVELNAGSGTNTRFGVGYSSGYSYSNTHLLVLTERNVAIESKYRLSVIEPVFISGKYRFNANIYPLEINYNREKYVAWVSGGYYGLPLKFSVNNINYGGLQCKSMDLRDEGDYYASPISRSLSQIFFYNELSMQYENINLQGQIVDFGEIPQPVTPDVYNWITKNADAVYPYSLTIKSYDGENVMSSVTEIPPLKEASLSTIGNQKTLSVTGINDKTYTIIWNSATPEGKTFVGLSNSPESNRVVLPNNTISSVSWEGDLVFYEAFGTYRPPATTFDINLYQNSAEVNRVDKGNYLVGVGTLSGALRDECSMLTPSIVYQSSDVPNFNYVYIPIFNRYYFVTSLSSVSKNVWRMELNCDVLMTYKNEILLLQGVVGRQEFDFNPMLVDSEIPTQDNPEVEIINIPSTAFLSHTNITGNLYNFVLTVIG